MTEERPTTFPDYLNSVIGRASGGRLMLVWIGAVLVWLLASLIWLPAAVIIPLAAFGLYLVGATAFHYGLLPEKAEWTTEQTNRDMRAHTATALAVTVCALLLAIITIGLWR